jgi:hypothetical protein
MLGYSTLSLIILGYREVIKQKFWLLVGVFFLVLSLGTTLKIGAIDTNFPLPYKYLQHLPVFSLLRKPDRCFLVIQFSVALLCAFSWKHIATWFSNKKMKLVFWGLCTVLIITETTGIPFSRFTYESPFYLKDLAASSEVTSLLHVPSVPSGYYNKNGRYMFFQTLHEKKIPQGYITSLAVTPGHLLQMDRLEQLYNCLVSGNARPILDELQKTKIDLLVIHKTVLGRRKLLVNTQKTLWAPFFTLREKLVRSRQLGPYFSIPLPEHSIEIMKNALEKELGEPLHEDSKILVFKVPYHSVLTAGSLTENRSASTDPGKTDSRNFKKIYDRSKIPNCIPYTYYWLEAEQASSITTPAVVASDKTASGEKYIFAPNGTENYYQPRSILSTHTVNIAHAGEYVLWGRIFAASGENNSFFVQINNGPDYEWKVTARKRWHWNVLLQSGKRKNPLKFNLPEGMYTIKIKLREDGTKLDKLLLTNNTGFVPRDKGRFLKN